MKNMRSIIPALAGALLLAVPAKPAAGQDLRYETVTRVDLPGAAGTIMRAAARLGGGSTEEVETTYISGQRMRTTQGSQSTIVDLADGRILILDHTRRSYLEVPLAAGMEGIREAAEQAARARPDGRVERGEADAEVRIEFRLDVDRTGQRERIAGHDAERMLLIMQAVTEAAGAGDQRGEQGGTLVVLTDVWTSPTAPMANAQRAFGEAAALREYTEAASSLMEVLTEAFAEDPRYRVAFQQAAGEMSQVEGVPLRTVTRIVAVAPGASFDRGVALGEESGQRDVAGAAQQAARGALGRVARRAAGLPGQDQPAAAREQPTQSTVITVTTEIRDIRTERLDPALFQVPEGYTRLDGR
jgi:hypothetical protein